MDKTVLIKNKGLKDIEISEEIIKPQEHIRLPFYRLHELIPFNKDLEVLEIRLFGDVLDCTKQETEEKPKFKTKEEALEAIKNDMIQAFNNTRKSML